MRTLPACLPACLSFILTSGVPDDVDAQLPPVVDPEDLHPGEEFVVPRVEPPPLPDVVAEVGLPKEALPDELSLERYVS